MEISTLRRRQIHRGPAKLRNGSQLLRRRKYKRGEGSARNIARFLKAKKSDANFSQHCKSQLQKGTLFKNIYMRDLGERKTKRGYNQHVQYVQIDPKHNYNPQLLERCNGLRHSLQTTPSPASCATTMDYRRPMEKNLSNSDRRTS